MNLVLTAAPYRAYGLIAGAFYPPVRAQGSHAASAKIDANAAVGEDAVIGAGSVVGEAASIGARSVLGVNVAVGRGVVIGEDLPDHGVR